MPQAASQSSDLPPLPSGYTLDAAPLLPAGFTLDAASESTAPRTQTNLWQRGKAHAANLYAHPGEALLGAAKEIPRLAQGALPQSGAIGQVPDAEQFNAGKIHSAVIEDAYKKVSGFIDNLTTPSPGAQESGARATDVASAIGSVPALPDSESLSCR